MYCMKCGKEINKGAKFCVGCGAPVEENKSTGATQIQEKTVIKEEPKKEFTNTATANNNQNNYKNNNTFNPNNIPYEYRPISMWGYFGYQILFSIPCIGFILLIIFALGGTENKNLRNFAASYFCMFIVMAIILAILMGFGVLGMGLFYSEIF